MAKMERVSYSLPPEQREFIQRLADEKYYGNAAAALREIIREAMQQSERDGKRERGGQ